jgi:hypothetical protein
MKRPVFASTVAFGLVALLATPALAQTKSAQTKPSQAPATRSAPAAVAVPAAPAKFVKSLKGTANIDFIEGPSKKVGNEIVTTLKVKNMSPLAISLFKVDEYWYDKKREVVTGDTYKNLKPFMPGEIIEVTLRAPIKPDLYQSQYQFSHAGGEVKPNRVKKFE